MKPCVLAVLDSVYSALLSYNGVSGVEDVIINHRSTLVKVTVATIACKLPSKAFQGTIGIDFKPILG